MRRLWAIVTKELLATLRDPRSRITLILPPILQLIIFGLATTLEVKNFDVGIYDTSEGPASTEFIQRLGGSPNIGKVVRLRSQADLQDAVDLQRVLVAIVIDERFDREVASGRPGKIGAVLDGRRTNAAQIVAGYLNEIAAGTGASLQPRSLASAGPASVVRHWFNPNIDYVWFTLPSLIMIICVVSAMSVAAQSVARERELGTFEQLMVSPLRTHEILIGKMIPPVLAGLFNGTLYIVAAVAIFGVPFTGSLVAFYITLFVYLLALTGLGMLVSTLSATQQQAFLGVFLVTVPAILLSGYASPVENMPSWLQTISLADPCRHYLVLVEGLFLKALPPAEIWANTWPLLVIASMSIGGAAYLFKARQD